MIGVVVPAHDEEALLPACLDALRVAGTHPLLRGEAVRVLVVLDCCSDDTSTVVEAAAVDSLTIAQRNVGKARAAGADRLLQAGARWLAFTDADTRVAPDWLVAQLEAGAPVVCGTIGIDEWNLHPPALGARFVSQYQDRDGHRHVHGANLGLSRDAYLAVGGFPPLPVHEDRDLVAALQRAGISIAWSARPRVWTSTRTTARAPDGFAGALRAHYAELGLAPDFEPAS